MEPFDPEELIPAEVLDVPDEDDLEAGPSEDDLNEFELRKAA